MVQQLQTDRVQRTREIEDFCIVEFESQFWRKLCNNLTQSLQTEIFLCLLLAVLRNWGDEMNCVFADFVVIQVDSKLSEDGNLVFLETNRQKWPEVLLEIELFALCTF